MKTREELKQLALDIIENKVYIDRYIENPRNLPMVFMVLGLMDKKQLEEFQNMKPVMVYEYLDKAGPRSINGMPNFFSFQFLTEEEGEIFFPLIKSLVDQRQQFLES